MWSEFFLNAFIVTVCTAYLIQRCWRVSFVLLEQVSKPYIPLQIVNKRLWVLISLGVFSLSLQIANIVMVTVKRFD